MVEGRVDYPSFGYRAVDGKRGRRGIAGERVRLVGQSCPSARAMVARGERGVVGVAARGCP